MPLVATLEGKCWNIMIPEYCVKGNIIHSLGIEWRHSSFCGNTRLSSAFVFVKAEEILNCSLVHLLKVETLVLVCVHIHVKFLLF